MDNHSGGGKDSSMVELAKENARLRVGVIVGAVAILVGVFVPLERGTFGFDPFPTAHEARVGTPIAQLLGIAPGLVAIICFVLAWRSRAKGSARAVLLIAAGALIVGLFAPAFEALGAPRRVRGGPAWVVRHLPWIPGNTSLIAGALVALVCADRARRHLSDHRPARLLGASAAVAVLFGLALTGLYGIASVPDIFMLERPHGLGDNDTWLLLIRLVLLLVIFGAAAGLVNAVRKTPVPWISRALAYGAAGLAVAIPIVTIVVIQGKDHHVGAAVDSFLQIYGVLLILWASLTHVLRVGWGAALDDVFA